MDKKEIQRFQEQLLHWYHHIHRRLPWRNTQDMYSIWVSEVMLQQTQVQTVEPYYHRFLKRFPDISQLAAASEDEVLKVWEGLGYYARARHLHRAARRIMETYGGEIPTQYASFRELPGVGEYIASAVLSIATNQPLAVLDGNVKRVLARLFGITSPLNRTTTQKQLRQQAELLLNRENPGIHNQAMMELGATVCLPRNPLCKDCPVATYCTAYAEKRVQEIPSPSPRKKLPLYRIAVGVVIKNGQLLITRRKSQGLLGGLWEFPGGKIQPNETPRAACVRELQEEVNLLVEPIHYLAEVSHTYSHFKIRMKVYICRYLAGEVHLNGPVDFKWISVEELEQFAFPGANRKFIPDLQEWVRKNL